MHKLFLALLFVSLPAFAASPSATPELDALGVRPVISKKVDPRFSELRAPEDRYFLEIKLGKLSRAQYDGVRALYGNLSRVPYDGAREYDLIDFLPPFIQATVNQVFLYKSYPISEALRTAWERREGGDPYVILRNGISSFTNCWNTTFEVLRSVHPRGGRTFFLYWPGRWEASDVISDDKFLSIVSDREARIGDVLLVSLLSDGGDANDRMLQHSAYLITSGLVFERTDSSDNDPYRIAYRSDVEKKYHRLFESERHVIEYRRMVGSEFSIKPEYSNFADRDSWQEGDQALLAREMPGLNTNRLTGGCESRMAGGCDPVTVEAHEVTLSTNPRTGRGILFGPRALLDRFQPLRGK